MTDSTDLGSLKARLRAIEKELNWIPVWQQGSPRAVRLAREAARLSAEIERIRLHRRWTVPPGTGPLSRFRLEIPATNRKSS